MTPLQQHTLHVGYMCQLIVLIVWAYETKFFTHWFTTGYWFSKDNCIYNKVMFGFVTLISTVTLIAFFV